ncbi:hypothetical protein VNO77_24216 [Canavalia gladiata]|uniref:RING-type domain-containing protein n=1 Tax=Canavalia gladiata TaxID=3824 RepID=A0AAN9L6L5_CANGL
MGKQKRNFYHTRSQRDHHPRSCSSFAEAVQCTSNMELLSDEPPHSSDPGALPLAPALDITDGSPKLLNSHPTMSNPHQSLGRSIFLKRSRHYYGHHYSRRNSNNHANASSSRGKEYREKACSRSERIRSNSLGMDAVPSDAVKTLCGICVKPLRRKFNFLGGSVSCCELSIVAVLVCGHVYHADCLEQRTSLEELRDPPCPVCTGLLLQPIHSKGQE